MYAWKHVYWLTQMQTYDLSARVKIARMYACIHECTYTCMDARMHDGPQAIRAGCGPRQMYTFCVRLKSVSSSLEACEIQESAHFHMVQPCTQCLWHLLYICMHVRTYAYIYVYAWRHYWPQARSARLNPSQMFTLVSGLIHYCYTMQATRQCTFVKNWLSRSWPIVSHVCTCMNAFMYAYNYSPLRLNSVCKHVCIIIHTYTRSRRACALTLTLTLIRLVRPSWTIANNAQDIDTCWSMKICIYVCMCYCMRGFMFGCRYVLHEFMYVCIALGMTDHRPWAHRFDKVQMRTFVSGLVLSSSLKPCERHESAHLYRVQPVR